ncbi:aminotransferase [Brevundimonas sp.]|uniref:aminotransferase n=1 Tax=Brevundimonas sp. TaxID=1871086 RepID=UPI003BAAB279
MRRLNPLFEDMPTSIFEEMSLLASATGAINLGQGFPEHQGPPEILQLAADALLHGRNQYPPSRGLPVLREAVAWHYNRHQGLSLTPEQVVVTSGATEALTAALLAVIQPGDEVIILEPAYDAYRPLIERAGGVARVVTLTAPDWRMIEADLLAAITPGTRAVVFNNPMNPTARAFEADELAMLAKTCVAHDLIAICDEVWEHIQFDGRRHLPLIAQPGMAERTIKIGSAGKIFSVTGWKVGFVCATPALIEPIAKAHQFITFTTPPNLQAAVATALDWDDAWFEAMRADYQRSRDRLASGLTAAGYVALPSQASYFLSIDLAASGLAPDDVAFCRRLVTDHGVVAIPLSAFCEARPGGFVRLCFAKSDATLDQAVARLGLAREAMLRAETHG